ncbi:MAG: polysaccharide ABC transporter ATP-binding protein [Salinivirgaceae bacterium]|jgi:lipopolysaccharide transport system ATP-binding protein|nr:polysaccharide ABC transporter ATP-binding protein [Salinivirgaceae bacterium]
MKPILEIKNISKKYKLRGQESPYLTFRDALTSGFKKQKDKNEFWALQDVSFDVYPGESIGIIGRNGAGKSTLLKILSRITPPTTGEIISRGRIASLLEVGTGFHAELSGRENVFLNGSILGLTKQEITKQFDAIVDFSGVEKFLDTPLKHYSSGMQLRLAFAVAAHLEPEILIIDEVLAVGDAEFQKKCLTKMGEVTNEGRTVLFVSHNISAISTLCSKSILLKDGNLIKNDKTESVIKHYLNVINDSQLVWENITRISYSEYILPMKLYITNSDGETIQSELNRNCRYYINFEFELLSIQSELTIGYSLFDSEGQYLFRSLHTDKDENINSTLKIGINKVYSELPVNLLNEGRYQIALDGGIHKKSWDFNPLNQNSINIRIDVYGDFSNSKFWKNKRNGIFAIEEEWVLG